MFTKEQLRREEILKSFAGMQAGNSRKPKFGEWLRGIWAGEKNPHRDGMFVREHVRTGRLNPGLYYELTNGAGEFWDYEASETVYLHAAMLEQAATQAGGEAVAQLALRNVMLYAAKNRREPWSEPLLRFCADAGVTPQITR